VFRQFVVKIAGRCDLACDHCYIYEHADQSWRGRPNLMPKDVATAVIDRIAEHAAAHRLPGVTVILHGGEPLLAGVERIRFLTQRLRETLPPGCVADVRIQTNGLQLDEAFCELFLQERVGVGISIDGDQSANDRHRRHANGRTSYPELVRAIRLLGSERYRPIFNGLLCTIDVENDPVAVFDALAAFDPPRVEFLLPHATWVNPPPGARAGEARYAEWLLAVHRRWTERGRPMDVRLFRSVADLLAGRTSRTEAIGLGPADLVVVETDGEIEQADSLKTAYDGAPATGFHVGRHSFDEAGRHPGFDARSAEAAALGPECRRCPILRICGGGLYAHRYDGTGFANPSVYCHDLYSFITGLAAEGRKTTTRKAKHQMTAADFTALGRNQGAEDAMAALRAAQLSKARLKLGRLAKSLAGDPGWALVQGFDARRRGVLNRVLADPFLMPVNGVPDPALAARIALSCAVVSSTPVEVAVEIGEGGLTLPGVGTIPAGPGLCQVSVDEKSAIAVDGFSVEPVRRDARLGPVRLRIEDLDPARDRFGHPVTGALTTAELAAWQDGLDAAAEILAARHPEALAEMAEALTTIVPLRSRAGRHLSATARSSFGALGIALPAHGTGSDKGAEDTGATGEIGRASGASETGNAGKIADTGEIGKAGTIGDTGEIGNARDTAETLACLLLHEFQHLKLGAVLDMFDLHDKSDPTGYPVGWRRDPRSLEAVLQGAYAHLAVVEYWRRRALATPDTTSTAAARHARRAADLAVQVQSALDHVAPSPALTGLGRRWVADMAAGAARWR
jgi:uncharacterized protein